MVAYLSACQFHLEGQEHGKNRDLPTQSGTLMTTGKWSSILQVGMARNSLASSSLM